jgi:hypothetical protein
MSVILNGTTGISTPGLDIIDLSTSGNTILGNATSDTLNVSAGTIVVDGTGNVGIGKTPASKFDVNGIIAATIFSGAGTSLTGTASSLNIGGNAATATLATTATNATNASLAAAVSATTLTTNGWNFNIINGTVYPIGKTKVAFVYTGANQSWVVPVGVTRIFVKMWGAGGGGGSYGSWRQGSPGGGGGYTQGLMTCTAGETITIRVGGGGISVPGAAKAWPDGGGASLSGGDNQYSANGGAGTSILIPSISGSAYCLYAGGGGGGGCVNGYSVNAGGAGGGLTGQNGCKTGYTQSSGINYGGGGTQSAGGTAGTGNSTTGGAGSLYQGGTHQNANCYGGGGGGGYYGGGSGAYGGSSMGGGGGGSGYVNPVAVFGFTATGASRNAALYWDNDLNGYTTQPGSGGEESGYGGDGVVIIYY